MAKTFKPVECDGVTLSCGNKSWPPTKILVYGTDLEEIRPLVSLQEYHRLKTWEQVCGITSMDPEKCLKCPHVLKDGVGGSVFGTGKRVQLGRNTPRKSKRGK